MFDISISCVQLLSALLWPASAHILAEFEPCVLNGPENLGHVCKRKAGAGVEAEEPPPHWSIGLVGESMSPDEGTRFLEGGCH